MEQSNISLQYGIHRTPSLGNDGELSECVNLIPQDGELVNLQEPVATGVTLNEGETLLYIHSVGGQNAYIVLNTGNVYAVLGGTRKLIVQNVTGLKGVTSVGLVLVISTPSGLYYARYNPSVEGYDVLSENGSGFAVPKIRMEFEIAGEPRYSQAGADITGEVRLENWESTPGASNKNYLYDSVAPVQGSISGAQGDVVVSEVGPVKRYFIVWDEDFRKYIRRYRFYIQGEQDEEYLPTDWLSDAYSDTPYGSVYTSRRLIVEAQFRSDIPDTYTHNVRYTIHEKTDWTGEAGETFAKTNISGEGSSIPDLLSTTLTSQMDGQKYFIFPFFIRYAIKLADDTLTSISEPILMVPNMGMNPWFGLNWDNSQDRHFYLHMNYASGRLHARLASGAIDVNKWADLVKSICVYVSRPIYTVKIPQSCRWQAVPGETEQAGVQKPHIVNWSILNRKVVAHKSWYYDSTGRRSERVIMPEGIFKDEHEIFEELSSVSEFRLYKEIPITQINDYAGDEWPIVAPGEGVTPMTLEGELLRTPKGSEYNTPGGDFVSSYNRRLLLTEGETKLYEDYDASLCMSVVQEDDVLWRILAKVDIETDNGVKSVTSKETYGNSSLLLWFFYPNMRATKATLYFYKTNGTGVGVFSKSIELYRHNYLLGAYWLYTWGHDISMVEVRRRVDQTFDELWEEIKSAEPQYIRNDNIVRIYPEAMPLSSEFQSVSVGDGRIMAICPITKALSQGQFGDFPLRAFCSDGIWALPINDEGKVLAAKPASRDVMVEGSEICQLDDAVVFVTNQGLKMITGSDVILLSAPVEGYNLNEAFVKNAVEVFAAKVHATCPFVSDTSQFVEQVKTAKMAYDYAHNLLHVFFRQEPAEVLDASTSVYKHYVYSFDTREWATQVLNEQLSAVVPGYPLSTLQFGTALKQYKKTVGAEPHIGYALTRPLALGDPLARKALYDLRVVGQQTMANTVRRVAVYVSNDNVNWHRLPSLKALSAKYYRFLIMSFMADTDTISGLTLQHDVRYSHKLRGH